MPSSSSMLFGSESWSNSLMLSGWVDVSGDGWGGVFGVHVLKRGGRTSQNRLSDNIIPLFFERPAHAGRTLTVKGLSSNRRSNVGTGPVDVSGAVELVGG